MIKTFRTACLGAIAVVALAGAAHAQWPKDKPIEIIVAFAPGGGTDVMFRTMEPFLEKALGTDVVILNRPGAGGEITYTAIAQAEPDGYTLSSINTPGFLTMQIDRKLRYDPADIRPIARIVEDPSMLLVRADSPFKSLKDLVEHAKGNPGAVSIGTTGVGTDEHMSLIQLEQSAGVDLTPIPFGGTSETRTALLGGHVDAIGMNVGEYLGSDNSQLRPLAQLSEQRSAAMPDLPTAKEQGYDVLTSSERGIGAPSGVPEDIRAQLAAAVEQVLADPEFQAQAKKQSLSLSYLPGSVWEQQMPVRLERFRDILQKAK